MSLRVILITGANGGLGSAVTQAKFIQRLIIFAQSIDHVRGRRLPLGCHRNHLRVGFPQGNAQEAIVVRRLILAPVGPGSRATLDMLGDGLAAGATG